MHYRKYGSVDFDVSTLGLGCMRLPVIPGHDSADIDEAAAAAMIHHAIDSGINYLDTAYPYHKGNSERVVGRALKGGYRERIRLATKLPVWLANTTADFDRLLDEQLKKLDLPYVDFYLLHALNKDTWKKSQQLKFVQQMQRAKADGRIKHIGFSFHDDLETFKSIIDAFDWEMCQIQLNIVDEHAQATVDGLKYAAGRGVAVVIMEPLKGGSIVNNVPAEARALLGGRSPQDWALHWLADFPEVSVILSGMSSMEQLKDNIAILNDAAPNSLTAGEKATLEGIKAAYQGAKNVGCTACAYCMPCPQGVDIPGVFKLYNNTVYRAARFFKEEFEKMEAEGKGPSSCVQCGQCEGACPQKIQVIDKLKAVKALFAGV